MTSALCALALSLFPAAAQEAVAPRVELVPGVGGSAGGVPGAGLTPGGAPVGLGPSDIMGRSVLPKADVIGPILGQGAEAGRGALAAGTGGAGLAGSGAVARPGAGPAAARNPARPGASAGPVARTVAGGSGPRRTPAADAPVKPGGPGGGPAIETINTAVQAIEGAKQAERSGDAAAMGRTLDTVFNAADANRRGDVPFDEVAAAYGLGSLAPAKQAERLAEIAETASPRYAPPLYRHAAQRAAETLAPAESATVIARVNSSAGRRAPSALKEVAREAVAEAHAGALKGKELAKVQGAIEFWNSQAYLAGRGSLSNVAELQATVARLQAAASKGAARAGKAPKVAFVKDDSDPSAGPRLRVEVKGGEQAASAVAEVPAALPELLSLAAAERSRLELGESDLLASSFDLMPPAGAGARATFRRRSEAGGSGPASLWAAARFWLKSAARGLWKLLARLWTGLLRLAGLADQAPALGPGLQVAASESQLAELRRALAAAPAIARGAESPRLVSGYRIGPSWARDGETVRLGRVSREMDLAAVERRFTDVSGILERRESAAKRLREHPESMGGLREDAAAALAAFERLAADRAGRRLAAELKGWLDAPAEAAARLDRPSPRRLLEAVAQEALDRAASGEASAPANLLIGVDARGRSRRLAVVELGEREAGLPPGVRALAAALARGAVPAGSAFLRGRQVWFRLGSPLDPAPILAGYYPLPARLPKGGRAELFADLSPAEQGGLLRARLETRGNGVADEARLYLAARVLYELGFSVRVEDGFLSAVADRDHNALTPEEAEDRFATALAALGAATRLDEWLPAIVEGTATREELGARLGDWAQWLLAEGALPSEPARAWADRRRTEAEREALRPALNRALGEAGLRELPPTLPLGQRSIDRWFNRPIEAGLARGELRADAAGRVVRASGYDAFSRAVSEARARPDAAAAVADVLNRDGLSSLRWETVGFAGGLQAVLGQRRLEPGLWLNVFALRDSQGGALAYARAERSGPRGAVRLDAGRLELVLGAAGLRGPARPEDSAKLGRGFSSPRGSVVPAYALSASGRPVVARLTYDKAKAAAGGFIFASPYLSLDDAGAAAASRGLLVTSPAGAGRTAEAEKAGVPAFVLPEAEWTEAGLRVGAVRLSPQAGGARVSESFPLTLREGAVVKLVPGWGRLELVPRDVQEVSLKASEALTAYQRSSDLQALASWTAALLDSGELSSVQKLALGQALLEGVSGSSASSAKAAPVLREALAKRLGAAAVAALAADR